MLKSLLIVGVFLMAHSTLVADVFKCKADGKTIYSQIPCSKKKAQTPEDQRFKKHEDKGKKEALTTRKNIKSQETNNSLYVEAIDKRVDLNNNLSVLKNLVDVELRTIENERKNINIYKEEEPEINIIFLDGSKASREQKQRVKLFRKKTKGKIKKSKRIIKKSKKSMSRLRKQIKRKQRKLKKLNIRIEKLVSQPHSG